MNFDCVIHIFLEIFRNIVEAIEKYGPSATRIWIGPHLIVYFSDPNDAEVNFITTCIEI